MKTSGEKPHREEIGWDAASFVTDSDVEDDVIHEYYSFDLNTKKLDSDGQAPSTSDAEGEFIATLSDGKWGPWATERMEQRAQSIAEYSEKPGYSFLKSLSVKEHKYDETSLQSLEKGIDAVLYIQAGIAMERQKHASEHGDQSYP